ncbi:MAG: hypothetical protein Fur009_0020 [Candidatus Microgenomates bacterium]
MNNDKLKINKEEFKKQFKQRLYNFVLKLIVFVDYLKKSDPVCRVISEQLVDSGTGILSNYLEALVSSSKKDFANYFRHSLKCLNESKMWIATLRDSNKCDKKQADNLLKELEEIGNIFARSLITLKSKN